MNCAGDPREFVPCLAAGVDDTLVTIMAAVGQTVSPNCCQTTSAGFDAGEPAGSDNSDTFGNYGSFCVICHPTWSNIIYRACRPGGMVWLVAFRKACRYVIVACFVAVHSLDLPGICSIGCLGQQASLCLRPYGTPAWRPRTATFPVAALWHSTWQSESRKARA